MIAGVGYYDWTIDDASLLPQVCKAMLGNIEAVALAFFDRHQDLGSLLRALEDDSRALALGPEDRVIYRAAVHWLLGDRRKAKDTLEQALAERRGKPVKKRLRIEGLLEKLRK